MHSASKVQLGTTQSSFKTVDNVPGSPATLIAGMIVRAKSDGTHTLTVSDGAAVGISLGRNGSNTTARTPVVRRGLRVPVLLQAGFTTPAIGGVCTQHATSGKADSSGTATAGIFAAPYPGAANALIVGYDEDGAEVNCALVDFPGGL